MRRISSWVDERSAPVTATTIVVAAGLVYTVTWSTLARHGWQSVSDLWNSAEIGLAIAHGHAAAVYGAGSQLDAPPGLEFALAPFMALGHALGLRTPAELHHGYAVFWLLLVPFVTVGASSVLLALDGVARLWRFSGAERLGLALVAGLGVASAVVFWGHPEDCVALAFVLWAALAVERDGASGPARAGWLLGLGMAFQPLALLAAAPVVARFGRRALPAFVCRLALPSVFVVLPELVSHAARTLHQIVDQPFLPADESSTPFSHLAHSLGNGMYSGGTLRLVATLAAVVLGWVACRHRSDLPTVLFVMSVAFSIRVVLESELLGFYFFPVIALCLVLTMRLGWSRFAWCAALAVTCIALGNRREHAIALWWPAIIATTVAMVALAYGAVAESDPGRVDLPRLRRTRGEEAPRVTISHVRLLDA
jgi:hypothetical protein